MDVITPSTYSLRLKHAKKELFYKICAYYIRKIPLLPMFVTYFKSFAFMFDVNGLAYNC